MSRESRGTRAQAEGAGEKGVTTRLDSVREWAGLPQRVIRGQAGLLRVAAATHTLTTHTYCT